MPRSYPVADVSSFVRSRKKVVIFLSSRRVPQWGWRRYVLSVVPDDTAEDYGEEDRSDSAPGVTRGDG